MGRAVKLSLLILVIAALPAAVVSRNCTTNRLVLANDASGPVHVSVVVREEGSTIWSGELDRGPPSLIPFEMSSGEGYLAVEVWHANDRMTQSKHGYIFPFDGFTHFVMLTDTATHYVFWRELEPQPDNGGGYRAAFSWMWRYASDNLSCADKRLWQAIAG